MGWSKSDDETDVWRYHSETAATGQIKNKILSVTARKNIGGISVSFVILTAVSFFRCMLPFRISEDKRLKFRISRELH